MSKRPLDSVTNEPDGKMARLDATAVPGVVKKTGRAEEAPRVDSVFIARCSAVLCRLLGCYIHKCHHVNIQICCVMVNCASVCVFQSFYRFEGPVCGGELMVVRVSHRTGPVMGGSSS